MKHKKLLTLYGADVCLICGYGVDLTGMVLAVIYKNSRFIMICNASQITIALLGLL
jgi:hypothetical protein